MTQWKNVLVHAPSIMLWTVAEVDEVIVNEYATMPQSVRPPLAGVNSSSSGSVVSALWKQPSIYNRYITYEKWNALWKNDAKRNIHHGVLQFQVKVM